MNKFMIMFFVVAQMGAGLLCADSRGLVDNLKSPAAKLHSVGLNEVKWTQGFWAERFKVCRENMIPNMWRLLQDDEISHSFANFQIAAGLQKGEHHGPPWHDGDFYKWLEAVASVYGVTRDEKLDDLMDEIIPLIAASQRRDGYIHTPVIIQQRQNKNDAKEFRERLDFETYNMGHLMTAASVHYRATGKTALLDVAVKATDFLYDFYKRSSPELARNAICPSHYMGVVEMYRTVRDPRYLELAKNLVEIRDLVENGTDHNQDRIPFRQQTRALGHAVRANYLYAGVADIYAETGDATLFSTLDLIWKDLVSSKLYITGGCGALYDGVSPDGTTYVQSDIQQVHQAYGRPFQLPNLTAHNESCANVGNILWNWRMLQVTGEARFADILELTLYNSMLSSISLDGKAYFYTNPLRVSGDVPFDLRWSRQREPYISCFCCPPNIVRTIAQVHNYAYSLAENALFIHLYGANELQTMAGDDKLQLVQETDYPWKGHVQLTLKAIPADSFFLMLRIPDWCKSATVKVNDVSIARDIESGQYFPLCRKWQAGDRIELDMDMPVRLVQANPLVEETLNQVAVMRGPVVYCLESVDLPTGVGLFDIALPADIKLSWQEQNIEDSRIQVLTGTAKIVRDSGQALYYELEPGKGQSVHIRLVPYHTWGNRGETDMSVWLPVDY
ncbi:glycoside hydrolase family 127 protein [candidate division KSB1 bacterium]|nr:glycoside hydrolase family 127 protein [candidate division KSB1 bacterium]